MNGHLLIDRLNSYLHCCEKDPGQSKDLLFNCLQFIESVVGPLQRGAEDLRKCHGTLRECELEIISLRKRNELLAAKVEVMDLFAQVLHTKPAERNITASPDVVFQIVKRLEGL